MGELVTVQARLSEIAAQHDDPEVAAVSEEIERLTSSLRENSMNIRMMPIRATFEKFRRLVHDLARDLGKNVELTIEGADTELDKTVIDQLSDPLMHLIRNSMDHGIESPELRAAQGKPATANIHLSARHSGASVLIGVSDDGGGIDAEAVRSRAIERGLTTESAQLSEQEIFAFIFQPGFSTAKQVTDVSGRGVGMDVVRQRVDSLRGSIDVVEQARQGNQRHAAPAADAGHHRRPAGEHRRCLLCAAAGQYAGVRRADAGRRGGGQRQASGPCARRADSVHPPARVLQHPHARGRRSSRS